MAFQTLPGRVSSSVPFSSLPSEMCMQCAMTAAASIGTASGLRSAIANRFGDRVSAATMKRVTLVLAICAVLASGLFVSGSG